MTPSSLPSANRLQRATLQRPGRSASDSLRLARAGANCACLYLYVHICITIRGQFTSPQRPPKDLHGPFLEAPAKTRNVWKAAPAAIKRDTTWPARPPRPRLPGPDALLPVPSASRGRAEHCAYLYHYPRPASHAETTLQRLARAVPRGAGRDPQRGQGGGGHQARHGLQALPTRRRICRTPGCGPEVADRVPLKSPSPPAPWASRDARPSRRDSRTRRLPPSGTRCREMARRSEH